MCPVPILRLTPWTLSDPDALSDAAQSWGILPVAIALILGILGILGFPEPWSLKAIDGLNTVLEFRRFSYCVSGSFSIAPRTIEQAARELVGGTPASWGVMGFIARCFDIGVYGFMMPIRSNALMILSIPILIYGLKCVVDSAYMQGLMLILASTAMGVGFHDVWWSNRDVH